MRRTAALVTALCAIVIGCVVTQALAVGSTFTAAPILSKRVLPVFLPAIDWNMNPEQVKVARVGGSPIVTGEVVEFFDVPMLGHSASVVCMFGGPNYQRLDVVLIILYEADFDPTEAYKMLLSALGEQYGEPTDVSRQWLPNGGSQLGGGTAVSGAYQEFAYYGGLEFHLSCSLEDWDGAMVASVLCQRYDATTDLDYDSLDLDAQATPSSPVSVFEVNQPTPTPSGQSVHPLEAPFVRGGIEWGMSRPQVRFIENVSGSGRATEDTESWLRYDSVTLEGKKVSIAYYFEGNALARYYAIFREAHADLNVYIDDFEAIGRVLAGELGRPASGDAQWTRYAYINNPEQYGLAVSLGDLSFVESWQHAEFSLVHGLVGEDHAITHYLEYAAPGQQP